MGEALKDIDISIASDDCPEIDPALFQQSERF